MLENSAVLPKLKYKTLSVGAQSKHGLTNSIIQSKHQVAFVEMRITLDAVHENITLDHC